MGWRWRRRTASPPKPPPGPAPPASLVAREGAAPAPACSTPAEAQPLKRKAAAKLAPPSPHFFSGHPDNLARVAAAAIEVRELRKDYGPVEAVRGLSFEVKRGEIFGLLGPNGAGKTTTVEILEGYRQRSAGDVRVLGH